MVFQNLNQIYTFKHLLLPFCFFFVKKGLEKMLDLVWFMHFNIGLKYTNTFIYLRFRSRSCFFLVILVCSLIYIYKTYKDCCHKYQKQSICRGLICPTFCFLKFEQHAIKFSSSILICIICNLKYKYLLFP